MTRALVDTNVLLTLLTDRDEGQQRLAVELVEEGRAGAMTLVVPQVVVTEVVFVLGAFYRVSAAGRAEILADLLATPGLLVLDAVPWERVLRLWPAEIPDFVDAILAAIATEGAVDSVATFDRDLQKRLRRLDVGLRW